MCVRGRELCWKGRPERQTEEELRSVSPYVFPQCHSVNFLVLPQRKAGGSNVTSLAGGYMFPSAFIQVCSYKCSQTHFCSLWRIWEHCLVNSRALLLSCSSHKYWNLALACSREIHEGNPRYRHRRDMAPKMKSSDNPTQIPGLAGTDSDTSNCICSHPKSSNLSFCFPGLHIRDPKAMRKIMSLTQMGS